MGISECHSDYVTRLFLVRHGETANTNGVFRYNGSIDVDITELGVRQMNTVADRLKKEPIKHVYSTGLIRTVKGAGIISCHHGIEPKVDERFKELHAGRWEGMSFAEVMEHYPQEVNDRYEDILNYRIKDGGESILDVKARVIPALYDLIQCHKNESVVIVAHGGVNRVILCHALNLGLENFFRIEQDYGCLNIIDFYDNTAVVRLVNGQ